MPEHFECMSCNHVSEVTTKLPKCPQCGSGTGIVSTRPADKDQEAREDDKHSIRPTPNEPESKPGVEPG